MTSTTRKLAEAYKLLCEATEEIGLTGASYNTIKTAMDFVEGVLIKKLPPQWIADKLLEMEGK